MRRALVMLAALLLPVACARTEPVAEGPIVLDTIPKEVTFRSPVVPSGPKRELCFEFDPPGGSRAAAGIQAVLVTAEGRREEFRPVEVDRRGEALVCLLHEAGTQARYRGVILSSARPVRVRQVRWWSGG